MNPIIYIYIYIYIMGDKDPKLLIKWARGFPRKKTL